MNNAERLVINCYHLPNKSMNLSSSGVVKSVWLSAFQHLGNSRLLLISCVIAQPWPVLALLPLSEEQCTAPEVSSSGVCICYQCCTTSHFFHPSKRFLRKILQQALLSSAAFTEKCFHIPLVTRLAIVTEYQHVLSQMHMIEGLSVTQNSNNRYLIPHHYLVLVPIPIPIPVSVEH